VKPRAGIIEEAAAAVPADSPRHVRTGDTGSDAKVIAPDRRYVAAETDQVILALPRSVRLDALERFSSPSDATEGRRHAAGRRAPPARGGTPHQNQVRGVDQRSRSRRAQRAARRRDGSPERVRIDRQEHHVRLRSATSARSTVVRSASAGEDVETPRWSRNEDQSGSAPIVIPGRRQMAVNARMVTGHRRADVISGGSTAQARQPGEAGRPGGRRTDVPCGTVSGGECLGVLRGFSFTTIPRDQEELRRSTPGFGDPRASDVAQPGCSPEARAGDESTPQGEQSSPSPTGRGLTTRGISAAAELWGVESSGQGAAFQNHLQGASSWTLEVGGRRATPGGAASPAHGVPVHLRLIGVLSAPGQGADVGEPLVAVLPRTRSDRSPRRAGASKMLWLKLDVVERLERDFSRALLPLHARRK